MYRAVPAQIDLPAMERDIAQWWEDEDIFARSLSQTLGGPRWTFYEGPPTANGTPGAHHVEARAFKDIFPRYRTMKGYHVPRQAGWDCHGLPVELAVERELGFSGKQDIEKFGIAEFNARCKESVLRHVDEFSAMTRRMGYWVDMDSAYWTMDPSYIDSVWWSLQQIFTKGLLVQDHRVAPYCPRCGTSLSDHELAQGYEDVVDPSVYVRFPVRDGELASRYPNLNLLVWTTTPWTLVSNTAVAAHPTAEYVVARTADGEHLVVARELAERVLGDDVTILETFPGSALEYVHYERPFTVIDMPDAHFVVLAEYVTTDDGTGLVHQAPAFGADDLITCRAYNLPVVNPITATGHFDEGIPLVGGQFFKHADTALTDDLRQRGLLFRSEPYEHAYPHCWRCHTPLLYYAQPSWYIKTTAIKDQLLEQNGSTHWYPGTIQWGRYGDWLTNNVDWALSRNRYWGTPLPIWRCPQGHLTAIGSRAELGERAGRDISDTDPHRPFVDDITFTCPECSEIATRVPEVIDCWYDSGSMPFAAVGYPHNPQSAFDQQYPADFICEAIDQTRGWFYTLMAIGTLVFEQSSYENVVCLGHILDEEGRKMSKHLGNVLEPIPLMDEHGADAVRWFMLASGSPWQARRLGHQAIADVVRKTLLTYWNTVAFQALYARAAQWDPTQAAPPLADRHAMDRWVLARAHALARDVDHALANFDTQRGGRLIAEFVDDLSNWYVRRSRRRFWHGDPAALSSLHEALRIVTLCMAPYTPFVTEHVWQHLFAETEGHDSVHLASWPHSEDEVIDDDLLRNMATVRRLVELGRAARAESGLKTRQPLARALLFGPEVRALSSELTDEIIEELNVIEITDSAAEDSLVDVTAKANFRALGSRFGKDTPAVAAAIAAEDPSALHLSIKEAGTAAIDVVFASGAQEVVLTTDDVTFTETPREGWSVASEGGESVALDLNLTPELIIAGQARDLVRAIQEARKLAGLEITDRISLTWASNDPHMVALWATHGDVICGEVLGVSLTESTQPLTHTVATDLPVQVSFSKV